MVLVTRKGGVGRPACYDEALTEVRRGPTRERGLALGGLDEARRWVDHIGLPNHLPPIDDLRGQLTR